MDLDHLPLSVTVFVFACCILTFTGIRNIYNNVNRKKMILIVCFQCGMPPGVTEISCILRQFCQAHLFDLQTCFTSVRLLSCNCSHLRNVFAPNKKIKLPNIVICSKIPAAGLAYSPHQLLDLCLTSQYITCICVSRMYLPLSRGCAIISGE